MTYWWRIVINSKIYTVKAVKVHTAVHKCLEREKQEYGRIIYSRLKTVKRIECLNCHRYYEEGSQEDHNEYWNHKKSIEGSK